MVSIRKRNSKTSYGLFWFLNFPHATRNFHAPTHFQLAHAQTNFPAVAVAKCKDGVKSINDCGRVAMVRRSRCMGGHLTDLMTVRSGTGKDLKKNM